MRFELIDQLPKIAVRAISASDSLFDGPCPAISRQSRDSTSAVQQKRSHCRFATLANSILTGPDRLLSASEQGIE